MTQNGPWGEGFLKRTFLHGVQMAGMYDGRSVGVAYGTMGTNNTLEEEERIM